MSLTTRVFAGFVLVASAVVLGTALLSQYWGGLAPCELCLVQRWPWAAAIVISLIVLLVGERAPLSWVALVFAIVFAIGVVLAFYHVGVEQHWFAGPSACTASEGGAMTVEQMRQQIHGTAPVLCDRPAWTLFGVSLAGWNLLASLIMTGCCIGALLQARGFSAWRNVRRGTA
ncbi:MAG TPA: disulfide bond formation protein B [Stellaceae bacterium]|nr:disulfide bond formation protein B [Stellaceae bacterium]